MCQRCANTPYSPVQMVSAATAVRFYLYVDWGAGDEFGHQPPFPMATIFKTLLGVLTGGSTRELWRCVAPIKSTSDGTRFGNHATSTCAKPKACATSGPEFVRRRHPAASSSWTTQVGNSSKQSSGAVPRTLPHEGEGWHLRNLLHLLGLLQFAHCFSAPTSACFRSRG